MSNQPIIDIDHSMCDCPVITDIAPGTRQEVIEAYAAMLLSVMLDKDRATNEDHQQAA